MIESVAAFMDRVAGIDWTRCPACAGHFVVTAVITRSDSHRAAGPWAAVMRMNGILSGRV
ncbi:MAG: hypothetical protein IPP85_15025 [Propionivibrio sp.]|nr:hypothetical protein [Propionivibrio sp.]